MKLYYFQPEEFERGGTNWFPFMDSRLLILLDSLRHWWGAPIHISQAAGAIGRELGKDSASQHNVDKWGQVRAVDVIPEDINYGFDANRFLHLSRYVGFTGIGLYPAWTNGVGVHLDTRHNASPGSPAMWGALNDADGEQHYVSLNEALDSMA